MSPWGKAGVLGLPGHWEARVGADSQGGRHVAPAPLWTSAGAVGGGRGVCAAGGGRACPCPRLHSHESQLSKIVSFLYMISYFSVEMFLFSILSIFEMQVCYLVGTGPCKAQQPGWLPALVSRPPSTALVPCRLRSGDSHLAWGTCRGAELCP